MPSPPINNKISGIEEGSCVGGGEESEVGDVFDLTPSSEGDLLEDVSVFRVGVVVVGE